MTLPRCALRHQSESQLRARHPAFTRWLSKLAMIAALSAATMGAALAQTTTISGVVTDAANVPVLAAQVSISGTRYAASTDKDGHFHIVGIADPAGTAVTLVARRIGYASTSVAAHTGDENVVIHLTATAVSLNEIVVTGTPGSTERRALGVDVAQIDAATLVQKAPVQNVQDLLNGRTPGVTLLASSGVVGAGSTVRIRGVSSFSLTNQPLIYVDGVRVDNSQGTGVSNQSFGAATTTRWNDFNPDDIESIEIVKGPAATTLYGTEAANGVIQIITKKGAIGKTTWDFNTRQGANWFHDPAGRLWTNWDTNAAGDTLSENYNELLQRYQDSTGQKNIFTTGYKQGYDLAVGGGTSALRYHVSGGYDRNEGVEPTNNDNNYTARANLQIFPNDKIDIAVSTGYNVNKTNLAVEAGYGGTTFTTYYMDPATIGTPSLGFDSGLPTAYHEQYQLFQAINRFTGSATVNHHPVSWFNQRLTLGIDDGYEDSEELSAVHHNLSYFFGTDADSGFKNVFVRDTKIFTSSYVANLVLPVTSSIRSTTSLGGDIIKRDGKYQNGSGSDFPAPGLTSLSSTTAGQVAAETDTLDNTVGIFAQEELAWNDRLFITGGVRLDNNSAFGSRFRNVYYPKVSGAWVISEEPFFHVSQINTLKLRAAYGESGQAPLPYSARASYKSVAGPFGASVTPSSFGNPDLGPERGYETELGLDAAFLHNRAGLEMTYYFGGTKDAILEQSLSPSLGYPGTQFVNAGSLTKHGFELSLHGTPYQTANTEWTLGLNIATADNKVTYLNGAQFLQATSGGTPAPNVRHVLGYPVGSWFGQKVVGSTLNSDGTVTNVMCDDGTSAHNPIACTNPDGTANAPQVFLGRTLPNFEGSVTSTLRVFKNFEFFVMLDTKRGYKKLDGDLRVRCYAFDLCKSNWFKDGVDPAVLGAQTSTGFVNYVINDASFVKLREVSLRYNLPDRLFASLHASGAWISVAGRNLATFTDYQGLDPEDTFQGGSRGFGQWSQAVTPQLMQFVTTVHLSY
jgi:TonB-linked SusC/RagA family outer membrane protein